MSNNNEIIWTKDHIEIENDYTNESMQFIDGFSESNQFFAISVYTCGLPLPTKNMFWTIYHIPSGKSLTPKKFKKIRLKELAQEFCEDLVKLGDWSEGKDIEKLVSDLKCTSLEDLHEKVTKIYHEKIKVKQ
jgi:hypothetical protein